MTVYSACDSGPLMMVHFQECSWPSPTRWHQLDSSFLACLGIESLMPPSYWRDCHLIAHGRLRHGWLNIPLVGVAKLTLRLESGV